VGSRAPRPIARPHARRRRVDEKGEIPFVLGTIDRRIGSGIDDEFGCEIVKRRG
jgi:hypothetical protein